MLFKVKLGKTEHEELIKKIRSINTKSAFLLSITVSVAAGLIFYLIETYFPSNGKQDPIVLGVSFSVFSFIAFLTLWRESAIWWVAIGSSICFYVLSFYFVLSIEHYSKFLRVVGYGGGAKVNIEHKDSKKESSDYYLLLRTSKSLITLESDKITVKEIPITTVSNINYKLGSQYIEFVNVSEIANK